MSSRRSRLRSLQVVSWLLALLTSALIWCAVIAAPPAGRPKPRKRYTLGDDVIPWIEEHCVYPSGEMIGQPFRLLQWQKDWILQLYECDEDGNLVHRWALLGIPKKNGKSTLIAALALYHLLGDPEEPDPWVVCAAASDRQADIVFNAAKIMCELSPTLREATIRFRWEIRPKGAPGKLERVAASAGKLDGKNISLLLIDELHEWLLENWTILTNGTVGRRRSLIVQITTAGYDQETICYREYEKGQRVLAGESDIPGYLFTWYGATDGDDITDPEVWARVNPSYGVLVSYEQLADKFRNVPRSEWCRYFLNMWVEAEDFWLPPGAWDACARPDRDLELGKGEAARKTFMAWDASTTNDSTAVVTGQWFDEGGVKVLRVRQEIWERPLGAHGNPVDGWRLPIAEVEGHVRESARDRFNVVAIPYDPMFVTWSASELESEGLPMIAWPQTNGRMCPATKAAYELIIEGRLEHDGDPVATRHVMAAKAVQTRDQGQRITKGKGNRKKIDFAVALVMLVGIAKDHEEESSVGISVYVAGQEGEE